MARKMPVYALRPGEAGQNAERGFNGYHQGLSRIAAQAPYPGYAIAYAS